MQSEQKKEFLLTGAYYAVLAAALYLFLRYLLWWLLPFLLAFAAARAMEPVILLLRRTVHFKRGFSAALLTLFLLFLLGGLLSLLLSALFTEATAFLTQLPTLLDALPALTGGLLERLRAYGALCPDWLRELLTAELSDWAAYGSTALAGLASRALALLGSMAAAVPAMVEMMAARAETRRVIHRASRIILLLRRSRYQSSVKPAQTERLLEALNENTTSTRMGR